jgi:uncharacterized protein (DUF302 family)
MIMTAIPESGPQHGMVHLSSPRPVAETLQRLESLVTARGLTILARIDHSGDAAKVGLKMPPTELLIFGNPKAGTPVMIFAPTTALDLPLKALVWQDVEGKVWLSYNSPEYLKQRHNIPDDLLKNISGIRAIAEEAVL